MKGHKVTKSQSHKLGEEKIFIAGAGGQGIMFLGRLIAQAAVEEDRNVTYIRSYGAEIRGGTSHCLVRISRDEIASPIFEKATMAIIMNQPSLDKFEGRIEKGGLLVLNKSVMEKEPRRKGIEVKSLKLNELALKLGSIKVANVIGLGLMLRQRPFFKVSSIEKALRDIFKNKQDRLAINLRALRLGHENG